MRHLVIPPDGDCRFDFLFLGTVVQPLDPGLAPLEEASRFVYFAP